MDVGRVEARDVEGLAERLVEFVKPYQEVRLPGPTVLAVRPCTWAECARRTVYVLREVGEGPTYDRNAAAPRDQPLVRR